MATRLRASPKMLFIWDFDYTFILDNSDTFIPAFFACAAAQNALSSRATPAQSWNAMVDDALQVLQRQGHSRSDIERACGHFPYDAETVEIVRRANARNVPCHIISDSNATFISSFLCSLPSRVEFASVETHPTYTDDAGLLRLRPIHTHSCDVCPVQMCKVMSSVRGAKTPLKKTRPSFSTTFWRATTLAPSSFTLATAPAVRTFVGCSDAHARRFLPRCPRARAGRRGDGAPRRRRASGARVVEARPAGAPALRRAHVCSRRRLPCARATARVGR